MTDYAINLQETLSIQDHWRAETMVDAIIYRNQFDKYHQAYLQTGSQEDLIFSFIFLQIYIECFLHDWMRQIVRMEFKPPRDNVMTEWMRGEGRMVWKKIDNFIELFFGAQPTAVHEIGEQIKAHLKNITDIRNLLIHGHSIAEWSDSDGNTGISEAKSFLTAEKLDSTVSEANELGKLWNQVLDEIMPRLQALKRVSDFYYKEIN